MKTGTVYKIVNQETGSCYVGSTIKKPNIRWNVHNYYMRKNCRKYSYFIPGDNIENFEFIILKKYQVVDEFHLRAYEQLWINKISNTNILTAIPFLLTRHIAANAKNSYTKHRYLNTTKIKKKAGEKISCECGAVVRRDGLKKHKNTNKHLNFKKK